MRLTFVLTSPAKPLRLDFCPVKQVRNLLRLRSVLLVAMIACLAAATWKMFQFHGRLAAIENPQWERRLADEQIYRHPIVLFGDSQMYNWPVATSFGVLPVIDRGLVGEFATQAGGRFEREALPLKPALVVILIGTNDLAHGHSTESILRSIEQMSSSARKHNAAVMLCSVLPVRGDAARVRPREAIEQLNSGLQALAHAQGVAYIDLYSELLDDHGVLAEAYTADGLHLNAAGYVHITKALLPRVLPYYETRETGAQSTAGPT